jgi:hypothetical protein
MPSAAVPFKLGHQRATKLLAHAKPVAQAVARRGLASATLGAGASSLSQYVAFSSGSSIDSIHSRN